MKKSLHRYRKDQSRKDVFENNRGLLWKTCKVQKYSTLGRKAEILYINPGGKYFCILAVKGCISTSIFVLIFLF